MIRAALSAAAGAWLALTLSFFALRILPGDAITAQMVEAGFGAAVIAERRAALGMDAPITAQYVRYVGGLLRGDLGHSLYTGEAVSEVIAARAGGTVALAITGFAIMMAFAVILASFAARTDRIGRAAQGIILVTLAVPGYVTGTLIVFAVGLAAPDSAAGVLTAALALGIHTGGAVAQALAESIRQARTQPYITAAHGRGLTVRRVLIRHLLPNAILPVLPLIAAQAGFLLSGTVITEAIFARPGLGRLMLDSVLRRDVPVVQGLVLLAAGIYAVCLMLMQAASHLIDRRPEA